MKPGSNFKYMPGPNDPNLYLLNAFSLSMIPLENLEEWASIYIKRIDVDLARAIISGRKNAGWNIISAIGHQSTAQIMSEILKIEVPVNRIAVKQNKVAFYFVRIERIVNPFR